MVRKRGLPSSHPGPPLARPWLFCCTPPDVNSVTPSLQAYCPPGCDRGLPVCLWLESLRGLGFGGLGPFCRVQAGRGKIQSPLADWPAPVPAQPSYYGLVLGTTVHLPATPWGGWGEIFEKCIFQAVFLNVFKGVFLISSLM